MDKVYLRECFTYNTETGLLHFKERPVSHFKSKASHAKSTAKTKGRTVDTIHNNGRGKKYLKLKVDGKQLLAHRVAWIIHYGCEPEYIDHINGDSLDNRIVNLRNTSMTENNRNVRMHKTNTSGTTGVHKNKKNGKFVVHIWDRNKQINLGTYLDEHQAIAARKGAEIALNYHRNHGAKK